MPDMNRRRFIAASAAAGVLSGSSAQGQANPKMPPADIKDAAVT